MGTATEWLYPEVVYVAARGMMRNVGRVGRCPRFGEEGTREPGRVVSGWNWLYKGMGRSWADLYVAVRM